MKCYVSYQVLPSEKYAAFASQGSWMEFEPFNTTNHPVMHGGLETTPLGEELFRLLVLAPTDKQLRTASMRQMLRPSTAHQPPPTERHRSDVLGGVLILFLPWGERKCVYREWVEKLICILSIRRSL